MDKLIATLLHHPLKVFLLIGLLVLVVLPTLSVGSPLKVGDKAPDFRLIGSDGQYYTLKQYLLKRPVVIAFFPAAFTGG